MTADLEPTTMRACGNPLCAAEFDIAAHLAGQVNAGRWMHNRLVWFLCPKCAVGDHVPDWAAEYLVAEPAAVPWCSCGKWMGTPTRPLAAAREQWEEHVRGARAVTQ